MKMAFTPATLLTIVGIVLSCNLAHAEVYRWTDENGKVHYSDSPPKNIAHEDISEKVRPINYEQSGEEREKLGKIFAPETPEEKQLKQQQQQAQRQQAAKQEQKCNEARRLYNIVKDERFYMIDEDGKSYDISKEEAKQRREEIEKFLQENC